MINSTLHPYTHQDQSLHLPIQAWHGVLDTSPLAHNYLCTPFYHTFTWFAPIALTTGPHFRDYYLAQDVPIDPYTFLYYTPVPALTSTCLTRCNVIKVASVLKHYAYIVFSEPALTWPPVYLLIQGWYEVAELTNFLANDLCGLIQTFLQLRYSYRDF